MFCFLVTLFFDRDYSGTFVKIFENAGLFLKLGVC